MKLFAISDIHLSSPENRAALTRIPEHPNDWLILAGDIGETPEHLVFALETLSVRFKKLIWVPGNHDLWTTDTDGDHLTGEDKYWRLVELCNHYGVLTPEDPYPVEYFGGKKVRLVPLFLLYDYSFRPKHVTLDNAIEWANESGVMCADESFLRTNPYNNIIDWCAARCESTEHRLLSLNDGLPTVLINHFPLRYDLIWIPRIPRFTIWCGTRQTEDWHLRWNATAVVYGHLHVPSTQIRDSVRFDEVSLGYPRQWVNYRDISSCVRQILPAPIISL